MRGVKSMSAPRNSYPSRQTCFVSYLFLCFYVCFFVCLLHCSRHFCEMTIKPFQIKSHNFGMQDHLTHFVDSYIEHPKRTCIFGELGTCFGQVPITSHERWAIPPESAASLHPWLQLFLLQKKVEEWRCVAQSSGWFADTFGMFSVGQNLRR